ncbi:MAG: 30S ribosomal protein S4 [Candidatus Amesbacteria bacterium]|nr:30S ribosomal protein S4 [Candidatus Amesbacteria bacterium]
MGHYTGPKNRLSRREGVDLFGKGNKLRRSTQVPGQHGAKRVRKVSDYGKQLREKQKVRRMYGIMERQFRRLLTEASRLEGNTGENLLRLLEMRLDNVVYRLGLVPTRNMARQVVGHGHVKINNKKLNIPSYQVKIGDEVSLSESLVRARENLSVPTWLDRQGIIGRVVSKPGRLDTVESVSEQLIVEFYSR